MSQLRITDNFSNEFHLNVTQFRSPMNATINSAQTRDMLHHFPIRVGQPDINFTVQYENLTIKHKFEAFVRVHQKLAQKEGSRGKITLWWPERNIENWTGFIGQYTVTEKRFEVAPSATFGVQLVDSMMSEETTLASRGIDLSKILGIQIPAYRGYDDLILVEPTRPSSQPPVNPDDTVGGPVITPPTGPTAPPPIGNR